MHIHPFRAVFPRATVAATMPAFSEQVREYYARLAAEHQFLPPTPPGCFIYRIDEEGRRYQGLVTGVELNDYRRGLVLRHEQTLVDKNVQQRQLLVQRGANVKPVLLAYADQPELDDWIRAQTLRRPPDHEFQLLNKPDRHSFWTITAREDLDFLRSLFLDRIPQAVIADGHHRFSSTLDLADAGLGSDFLMCAFFPLHALRIHNFNRIVNVPLPTDFWTKLGDRCHITPLSAPAEAPQKHQFTAFVQGQWYALTWRQAITEATTDLWEQLDVNLFDKHILENIYGIADVRHDQSVTYVEGKLGPAGLREALPSPDAAAFCLYPITHADFLTLTRAGRLLPPKSTWFEPRMLNGLIVQSLREA